LGIASTRKTLRTRAKGVETLVEFHELSEFFPLVEGTELQALVDSIKADGLDQDIILYEGKIIDGRNRYRACELAGIEPRYKDYEGLDPAGYALRVNSLRRNLTQKDKREGITKFLKRDPSRSDTETARLAGVTNKTIASVRRELERRKEIPYVEARSDTKGRKQPARKRKKPTRPKPDPKPKKEEDEKITATTVAGHLAKLYASRDQDWGLPTEREHIPHAIELLEVLIQKLNDYLEALRRQQNA